MEKQETVAGRKEEGSRAGSCTGRRRQTSNDFWRQLASAATASLLLSEERREEEDGGEERRRARRGRGGDNGNLLGLYLYSRTPSFREPQCVSGPMRGCRARNLAGARQFLNYCVAIPTVTLESATGLGSAYHESVVWVHVSWSCRLGPIAMILSLSSECRALILSVAVRSPW